MVQSIVGAIVGLLGLHMLLAALRHRALAEAFIGLFFVSSAVGAETALRAIEPGRDSSVAAQLMLFGVIAFTAATAFAYAFTYTVFRRGEAWALGIVLAGTALMVWGGFVQLGRGTGAPDTSALCVEFLIGRFASFAWGTYEALRAYAMARKRLALGLADPVVVNRFLLFGVWFGVMGILPLTLAWTRFTRGAAAQVTAAGFGPQIIGTIMIVALVLTFFPPRKYLAWVVAANRQAVS
jgi:hypothetical protein